MFLSYNYYPRKSCHGIEQLLEKEKHGDLKCCREKSICLITYTYVWTNTQREKRGVRP